MRVTSPENWHLRYLGKPWVGVPNPPESYTCGELLRAVHRDLLGIETPPVPAPDARVLRDCIDSMMPGFYGLRPLPDGEAPREFDAVFLTRNRYEDHCGIACMTSDGLLILHCQQRVGVHLSSPSELLASGYRGLRWYRHERMDDALTQRGWLHA